MPITEKITPAGVPSVPDELVQSIEGAIQHPERSQGIQIRMAIEGGQAEERYTFHFEASSEGLLTSQMSCRLTSREARARSGTLSRDEFVDLLRHADIAKLVQVGRPLARVPPCSLLGRIEITDGIQRVSFVFMADPGQAEQAGMEPSPELARLVERIFEVSAKHMDAADTRSLRP